MSTVPSLFESGSSQEILAASATGTTTAIARGCNEGSVLQVVLNNTDAEGTLEVVGGVVSGDMVAMDIVQPSGSVLTSIAVTAGVDVDELIDVPVGVPYLAVRYTRTSGGASDEFTISRARVIL